MTGTVVLPCRNAVDLCTYVSFLLVGTGCGWFLMNAWWGLLANQGGVLPDTISGRAALCSGSVGLVSGLLYFLFTIRYPSGLSMRREQFAVGVLIATTILGFALQATSWSTGPDQGYPMLTVLALLANTVGNLTFYVLFPLVSTHYGGWLVAPVRAGSDLSSLVVSLIDSASYIDGKETKFPIWVTEMIYACIAAFALVVWIVIVRRGIGLRKPDRDSNNEAALGTIVSGTRGTSSYESPQLLAGASQEMGTYVRETYGEGEVPEARLGKQEACLKGLACPRSFAVPVTLATITQVCLWALNQPLGMIGAAWTDPNGCDGGKGDDVYRRCLTSMQVLVPVASILSSVLPCRRGVFIALSMLQVSCCVAVVLAASGTGLSFWQTPGGAHVFVACFAIVGALEGYLLTMAYRYIGDDETVGMELRQSSSRLLSLLGVVVVNPLSLTVGGLINHGLIACK